MFRNINDVIAYLNGDWARQNELMDFYTHRARRFEEKILQAHPELEEDLRRYSSCVTACSSMSGARLGMKEVEKLLDKLDV